MGLPQRILIMRLSAMGDVAMSIPVILALKQAYPSLELVVLSRKRFLPIFSQIEGIECITAEVKGRHKGILGLYKLAKEIKKHRIDAVADFHNVLRTKILRNIIGVNTAVIDKGRADKKRLVEDPNFFQELPHTTERYADVLRSLGYELELSQKEFLAKPPLTASADALVGASATRWIGFAPFAAHATKALSVHRAHEVLAALSQIENVEILLFGGGQDEVNSLSAMAADFENVINIAGATNFESELALMARLDVMLAMDSGNGHLAALYGVPVVTLWGNTHPYAGFAPYTQSKDLQLTADRDTYPLIPTSIFGNKIQPGYESVTDSISTDDIVAAINLVLNK